MYARQFVTLFGKRTLAQQVAAFFVAGEQGVWFDPSDISTLFQDSAGTTPVTALGDPVGKILDKSGRGNHATQGTAASRPVWQKDASGYYYLGFDGVDDSIATGSINFTSTDKMSLFAGLRKSSDAAAGVLVELTNVYTTPGGVALFAPPGAASAFLGIGATGTTSGFLQQGGHAAPETAVIAGGVDVAGATKLFIRVNGVQSSFATTLGTGNLANGAVNIGRRAGASTPFNGRIYSLIMRGVASGAGQIVSGEAYTNSKTGAY